MESLLRAPVQASKNLARFWSGYFQETPVCTEPDCEAIALNVDPFFPYLDDLNRCHLHHRELEQPQGSVS